ncbi:MAG: hypothetical protein HOD92_27005 [Deltaproteobacteria bacterium]|jgi:replicative DNA helicase|nr:hypothetical protein [Deltaproteobacteria bacterium]
MKIQEILINIFDLMEKMSEVPSEAIIQTGYREIDILSGGIKSGELFLITGENELGKHFSQNIIINQIQNQTNPSILIFCTKAIEHYTMQLLSIASGVNYTTISRLNPPLEQADWDKLSRATEVLSKSNIEIIDQRRYTLDQLRVEVEEANIKMPVNLIVVDSFEPILVETGGHGVATLKSKYTESGEFNHVGKTEVCENDNTSKKLKTLAEIFNIPILVVSNSNKGDFADQVYELGEVGCDGSVYINVTKNKSGLTGKVGLYYTEESTCFDSCSTEPKTKDML